MKISHLKQKLLFTAGYAAILVVWNLLDLPSCMWVRILGIPCPGCGMTRACLAALRLDFAAAFHFHPMFWSIPLLYLYFLSDKGVFGKKWVDRVILYTIGAGFLLNWIRNILLFFVG